MSGDKDGDKSGQMTPGGPASTGTKQRADAPSEEQEIYWKKDLELKEKTLDLQRYNSSLQEQALGFQRDSFSIARWSLRFSIVGFGLVIASLWINTTQVSLNTRQLGLNFVQVTNNALQLKDNTQQSMTKLTIDLDRMLFDHPELIPYLEGNANPTNATNQAQIAEAAIMMLDVFDVAAAQTGSFKDQWTDPAGWTNWIVDDFSNSPFLRAECLKYAQWYNTNMPYLASHVLNPKQYRVETNAVVKPGG